MGIQHQFKKLLRAIVPPRIVRLINLVRNPDSYYILHKDGLTYAQDLLYTHHSAPFMEDPHFLESYSLGKSTNSNLVGDDIHWRIHVLCWAAAHASRLAGDFVDCGVHTGFFARAVMHYSNFARLNKKYYLLDTFSGMDPRYSNEREMERHAMLGYGCELSLYEQVQATFNAPYVEIIRGAIPETLNRVRSESICYISIDMNSVLPEVEALEFFWDRLVPGGVIILDDYGYANSMTEQRLAHDAFARRKGVQILSLPTCQGLLLKP